jgi:hypothetical protein
MHKIREMMGKRDFLYILKDMIEFDACNVEVATTKKVKENLYSLEGRALSNPFLIKYNKSPAIEMPNSNGFQNWRIRICSGFGTIRIF